MEQKTKRAPFWRNWRNSRPQRFETQIAHLDERLLRDIGLDPACKPVERKYMNP